MITFAANEYTPQVDLNWPPTSTSPFHRRLSTRIAARPARLIAVMPRKACWPYVV